MAQDGDHDQIGYKRKRKGISALFPYAVLREQYGEGRIISASLRVTTATMVESLVMGRLITKLFDDGWSLNRDMKIVSRYALWHPVLFESSMVTRWAAAALTVPYTEAVGRNVVNALLQFASLGTLHPYIPVEVWALLKKRPLLPPICMGRSRGTMDCVVRRVRKLGDIEILTSYFLILWSEWNIIRPEGLANVRASIREDFAGIGMRRHREELIERLDQVLGKLEPGSEYLKHRSPWIDKDPQRTRGQYQELKEILLDVDREATEILTSTPS